MKKYTIGYRSSMGSFLDYMDIEWTPSEDLETLTIELENDEALVNLIFNYSRFLDAYVH
jgi:hypothetical protein